MTPRRVAFDSIVRAAVRSRGAALMGICNVTPDSFSDGGLHYTREAAFARVDELLREGADVIDIGGESTRPTAREVPADEQLARVLDVVRYASDACRAQGDHACVSIDTRSPEVARASFEAGAAALNDVSCLADEGLAHEVARADAAYVLMHSRAAHGEMRGFGGVAEASYVDVVDEVAREWREAAARAMRAGVREDALYMDPGLGFAKAAAHSLTLLGELERLGALVKRPLVVGASRKSFLRAADPEASPEERLGASIAAALVALRSGTYVLRVHDVRATRQALLVEKMIDREGASVEVTAEPRAAEKGGIHA